MNFETNTGPGGPHMLAELAAFRGDIPLDDDDFMADLLGDGAHQRAYLRMGKVFLDDIGTEAASGSDTTTGATGTGCHFLWEGTQAYPDNVVYTDVKYAGYEDNLYPETGHPRRNRRRTMFGAGGNAAGDGDAEDDGYMGQRGPDGDPDEETDSVQTGEPDHLDELDHEEQITPTYINMIFNATSMIPLANVGRMLKDEPIERIDEEYETGHGGGASGGARFSNDFGPCIPVVDFYALNPNLG